METSSSRPETSPESTPKPRWRRALSHPATTFLLGLGLAGTPTALVANDLLKAQNTAWQSTIEAEAAKSRQQVKDEIIKPVTEEFENLKIVFEAFLKALEELHLYQEEKAEELEKILKPAKEIYDAFESYEEADGFMATAEKGIALASTMRDAYDDVEAVIGRDDQAKLTFENDPILQEKVENVRLAYQDLQESIRRSEVALANLQRAEQAAEITEAQREAFRSKVEAAFVEESPFAEPALQLREWLGS